MRSVRKARWTQEATNVVDIYFTSDWHLSHENIIRYSGRPFANAREMDEALVTLHNEIVRPQDHVYNLGDVTMLRGSGAHRLKPLLERFNGHKRLLLGNHDHCSAQWYLRFFEKVKAVNVLDNILFTHIPVHPSSLGRFVANVHGHTHTQPDYPAHRRINVDNHVTWVPWINVCVEKTDYRPIHLDEVKRRIRLAKE